MTVVGPNSRHLHHHQGSLRCGTVVAAKVRCSAVEQGHMSYMDMRQATARDAERIAEIHNWYVLKTIIMFETDVVSPQEITKRVQKKIIEPDWLVGETNQEVIGHANYGPFRQRDACHDTVESTIYLAQESMGRGFWQGSVRSIAGVSAELLSKTFFARTPASL